MAPAPPDTQLPRAPAFSPARRLGWRAGSGQCLGIRRREPSAEWPARPCRGRPTLSLPHPRPPHPRTAVPRPELARPPQPGTHRVCGRWPRRPPPHSASNNPPGPAPRSLAMLQPTMPLPTMPGMAPRACRCQSLMPAPPASARARRAPGGHSSLGHPGAQRAIPVAVTRTQAPTASARAKASHKTTARLANLGRGRPRQRSGRASPCPRFPPRRGQPHPTSRRHLTSHGTGRRTGRPSRPLRRMGS